MADQGARVASAFTRKVVNVINAFGDLKEIKTNQQFADATGIKKSKIDRIRSYAGPISLDELQLFADAVGKTAGQILDEALTQYGGLPKLVRDLRPPMSEGSPNNEAPANVAPMFPETVDDLEVVDHRGRRMAAETGENEADLIGGNLDEGSAPSGSFDEGDGSPRTP